MPPKVKDLTDEQLKVRPDESFLEAIRRQEGWEGWQKLVTRACRPAPVLAHQHLWQRLDRWPVDLLPGLRPARALRHIQVIAHTCQPRVLAAYLRTIFDGWVTRRR